MFHWIHSILFLFFACSAFIFGFQLPPPFQLQQFPISRASLASADLYHPNNDNHELLNHFSPLGLYNHTNRRIAEKCKQHCSVSDPNSMPCWNATLHYYEQMLAGFLRRTVATEASRVLWFLANHEGAQLDFALMAYDSLRRFKQLPLVQRVRDDNNWLSAHQVYERISPALMDDVRSLVDKMLLHYGDGQFPQLGVDCPHGCERAWDAWKWLFLASLLVSILLLSLLFLLVFMLDHRECRSWALEGHQQHQLDASGKAVVKLGKGAERQQQIALKVIR